MFALGIYVMTPICIYMSIIWLLIYFILNIFQAGCCVGCPNRGSYCPPIFGIYLSNILSEFLYKDFENDSVFIRKNAKGGELTLYIFLLYPTYWLFQENWIFLLIYLLMILLHLIIFMPTQCKKCSYNKTCPGGKTYFRFFCKGRSGKT